MDFKQAIEQLEQVSTLAACLYLHTQSALLFPPALVSGDTNSPHLIISSYLDARVLKDILDQSLSMNDNTNIDEATNLVCRAIHQLLLFKSGTSIDKTKRKATKEMIDFYQYYLSVVDKLPTSDRNIKGQAEQILT